MKRRKLILSCLGLRLFLKGVPSLVVLSLGATGIDDVANLHLLRHILYLVASLHTIGKTKISVLVPENSITDANSFGSHF